jgi:hypothetical protein
MQDVQVVNVRDPDLKVFLLRPPLIRSIHSRQPPLLSAEAGGSAPYQHMPQLNHNYLYHSNHHMLAVTTTAVSVPTSKVVANKPNKTCIDAA